MLGWGYYVSIKKRESLVIWKSARAFLTFKFMSTSLQPNTSNQDTEYPSIRARLEAQELQTLHAFAAKSVESRGREFPKAPCELRTAFQRDRDRIVHAKAFRRLSHKTQMFISPKGDHYRTRLTHSLEVAQVSRTIARALGLNEDLTESIALGHDLGHPPFGHAGEHVLDKLFKTKLPGGFHHQKQSLRIARVLEELNLSLEVLDGIEGLTAGKPEFLTMEAQIVDLADRIAYLHHDVEDARRAGLMQESDLPKDILDTLGLNKGVRLNRMVLDLIQQSQQAMAGGETTIKMSAEIYDAKFALRQWMFQHIYLRPAQIAENEKVQVIINGLYEHLHAHPEYAFRPEEMPTDRTKDQQILDYIAGMTDRFAIDLFKALLLPHPYASGFHQDLPRPKADHSQ